MNVNCPALVALGIRSAKSVTIVPAGFMPAQAVLPPPAPPEPPVATPPVVLPLVPEPPVPLPALLPTPPVARFPPLPRLPPLELPDLLLGPSSPPPSPVLLHAAIEPTVN